MIEQCTETYGEEFVGWERWGVANPWSMWCTSPCICLRVLFGEQRKLCSCGEPSVEAVLDSVGGVSLLWLKLDAAEC
jgi:hypothetical protein